jgi:hypothetical protein
MTSELVNSRPRRRPSSELRWSLPRCTCGHISSRHISIAGSRPAGVSGRCQASAVRMYESQSVTELRCTCSAYRGGK